MSKVLLVNPALAYSTWNADITKPSPDTVFIRLGLAYLSSALKSKGHEVFLADLRTLSGWDKYSRLVKEISPDFIGVTMHSVEFSIAVEAAKIAKEVLPNVTAVAGGIHPTMFPQECIDTGVFDYVLQGEGEISLPLLVENPSRFPKIFWGETPDLDEIQFPDRKIWSDFNKRMYSEPFGIAGFKFPLPMAELMNVRGCPFKCSFCCGPGEHQLYTKLSSSGKRISYIRGRSVSNVIAELEMLIDKYGINSVMFHDDQFIMSPKWVEEFVNELHNSGLVKYGLKWVTSSRADIICRNEDLIGKMAEAGLLLLIIGFESFSPRILKWFEKTVEVEQNFKAAEICQKNNIKIWANYILGVRTDTGWHKEDDLLTIGGVLKINPVHYSPAFYTPVPGSKLYTFYHENNLIEGGCSVEDLSNRGKIAPKLKGVDYCFLESIMIDDSIFSSDIDIKESMKNYSPEKKDTDDLEYIRTKSIDAAACIIKVLHKRVNGLISNCIQLQSSKNQALSKVEMSDKIINKMLNSAIGTKRILNTCDNGTINSKVSIVIPVLNGGNQLSSLLAKIRKQEKVSNIEILVIDSGSTDNTVQISREFEAKLIEIPKEEFNHGATRQLGVEKASGEFIVFTVHDACPVNNRWLYKTLKCFRENPDLSVISGIQMVNEDADLYSKWINEQTYKAYGLQEDLEFFLKDTSSFEYLPDNIRRTVSFVDDVCACYRKEALQEFGFRNIPNAEDIDIGVRMAKAGLHLGFLYTNGVYHWHSDDPAYFLKRHFNGIRSFVEILGNGLPDFKSLDIDSFEDICLKSAVLYHTIRLSLEEWNTNEMLTPCDLHTFIKVTDDTIQNFSRKYKKSPDTAEGNHAFKKLLDSLDCRISKKALEGDLFKKNHLIFELGVHVQNLLNCISGNIHLHKIHRMDFSDAIFKIAASRIGDTIGQWFMLLKRNNRQNEMHHIETMLSKGVCRK